MTQSMLPTQIGPYRVIRSLGEGGMGTVYEAVQDPIHRHVAVKILRSQYVQNPDVLNRFFNETRAVNLIEHPTKFLPRASFGLRTMRAHHHA